MKVSGFAAALVLALPLSGATSTALGARVVTHDFGTRCSELGERISQLWPEPGTQVVTATARAAGPEPVTLGPPGTPARSIPLPAHCDVVGKMRERTGIDGQSYAIRFRLRLPAEWNGRLFMQGGGGTNGEIGDAIGLMAGPAPALAQGYAVLSQDSGHDNARNAAPERGGVTAFGLDPQARAEYGGASLKPVTLAAKALIHQFYGHQPRYSYFMGCSKGGQEGMVLAQRHPELYDGIIASAPGFSLPRAALAEVWDTQAFASVVKASGAPLTPATLASAFSDADLRLAQAAVLDACDTADGLKDGIISAVGQCHSAKVLPQLRARQCAAGKQDGCLSRPQIDALQRVHDGVRTARGERLYASFPWDAGWVDMGWRVWKLGSEDGRIPALNVAMGGPAMARIFTVPPRDPGTRIDDLLSFAMRFDFDRDASAIYARSERFPRSAWEDIGARSADLGRFRARGGRLIVPHGVSDPVFSIEDTLAWWREVDQGTAGQAAQFVRVFPVPGMAHCAGGRATDQADMFGALVAWVEQGRAPDRIEASAGPASPWPTRRRPLCPYPSIARLKPGATDIDKAESFQCVAR